MLRSFAVHLVVQILCVLLLFVCPSTSASKYDDIVIRVYSKADPKNTLSEVLLSSIKTTNPEDFDKGLAEIWKIPELKNSGHESGGQRRETDLPWRIQKPKNTPYLKVSDTLFVEFARNGSKLKLDSAHVTKVELKVNGIPKYAWTYMKDDANSEQVAISLSEIEGVEPASRVEVEVALGEDERVVSRNFILYDRRVGYSIADKETYFWFPVAIFSTNLSTGDKGMPFAAMPISIACGVKHYLPKSEFYVGTSIFAGLVWAQTTGGETDNKNAGTDIFLSRASAGPLIDIGGYFYLGSAYVLDFVGGEENPGASLVLGIGPRLLEFLK